MIFFFVGLLFFYNIDYDVLFISEILYRCKVDFSASHVRWVNFSSLIKRGAKFLICVLIDFLVRKNKTRERKY
jgi:hypothetical protein